MTMSEYAIFRSAAKLMTPDELLFAIKLAEMADAGDSEARETLWTLALAVLNSRRRKAKTSDKRKSEAA